MPRDGHVHPDRCGGGGGNRDDERHAQQPDRTSLEDPEQHQGDHEQEGAARDGEHRQAGERARVEGIHPCAAAHGEQELLDREEHQQQTDAARRPASRDQPFVGVRGQGEGERRADSDLPRGQELARNGVEHGDGQDRGGHRDQGLGLGDRDAQDRRGRRDHVQRHRRRGEGQLEAVVIDVERNREAVRQDSADLLVGEAPVVQREGLSAEWRDANDRAQGGGDHDQDPCRGRVEVPAQLRLDRGGVGRAFLRHGDAPANGSVTSWTWTDPPFTDVK